MRTLQRMRGEGTGPAFLRVGRLIRYRESALDEWLAERECRSTSEPGPCARHKLDSATRSTAKQYIVQAALDKKITAEDAEALIEMAGLRDA